MGILKKKESSQVGNLRFYLKKMQKKKSKLNLNKQNEKKKKKSGGEANDMDNEKQQKN